jgi:hypothetical protein
MWLVQMWKKVFMIYLKLGEWRSEGVIKIIQIDTWFADIQTKAGHIYQYIAVFSFCSSLEPVILCRQYSRILLSGLRGRLKKSIGGGGYSLPQPRKELSTTKFKTNTLPSSFLYEHFISYCVCQCYINSNNAFNCL